MIAPSKPHPIRSYTPILILFILGDVICDNYVLQSFTHESPFLEGILFLGILVLQTIAAPLQAGYSDYYCRKKSLLIALSASLVSLIGILLYNQKILFFLPTLIFICLIKGALGNTIPLAWAAIADTRTGNFRISLAYSTASYAVGYLILYLFDKYLGNFWEINISIALFFILILICKFILQDARDKVDIKENHSLSSLNLAETEIASLTHYLKNPNSRSALIAFSLWETSLYSILILLIDFKNEFSYTAIFMMIGYLVGVFIIRFCKKIQDERMIKIGYFLSVIAVGSFFTSLMFGAIIEYALPICYFFYSIGNAFLSPSMLSLLAKYKKSHERGKIFGLVISADTIGFLAASIILIMQRHHRIGFLPVLLISYAVFIVSWYPFSKYKRTQKEID